MSGPICPQCNGENGRHYTDCGVVRVDAYETGRKTGRQEALLAVGEVCNAMRHPGAQHLFVAFQSAVRALK